MSIFYRPEGAALGSVIPFFDGGQFKLFYLRSFRGARDEAHRDGWAMLETRDHVRFEERDLRIEGGAGCVLRAGDTYHMFYGALRARPDRDFIRHAVSADLSTWTELPEDRFFSDGRIYAPAIWRDPFVLWSEEERCWWMLLAAQENGPASRRGCVGLCKSDDLRRWRCCEPLYAPASAGRALESPELFRWGEWYYLLFSTAAGRCRTLYRMSRSPNGPWFAPELDTFDGRAFRAGRTGTDGVRRLICGCNPTRERDEFGFNPRESAGRDCDSWDSSGNLIVHELWQERDGTLWVKPPDELRSAFGAPAELHPRALAGEWTLVEGSCAVSAPCGYASLLLGEMPAACCLTFDLCLEPDAAQAGVALHVDEDFAEGYYVAIEPWRRRIEFKSPVRMTERGGQMFPYEVELERPLPASTGRRMRVELLAEGTILEVYVDGRVALSARMYNRTGASLGLFVESGGARFENLSLHIPDPSQAASR